MTHFNMTRLAVLTFVSLLASSGAEAASPAEEFAKHTPGSTRTIDHAAWTKLLGTYVMPSADGVNRVRYADFKQNGHVALKAYVKSLEAAGPSGLDLPEQFAFWANLYNAKTIDVVLDAYPVKSIKDISLGGSLTAALTGGPWKAKVLKVGSRDLSLDDIEHGILRPVFKDPRVHYAVNCASIGCPNLLTAAFTGATLNDQLDAAARSYVNHPRGFAVTDGSITASSIYNWFSVDFGGNAAGVLVHARQYAEPALKRKLDSITTIPDYGYDWSLNDAGR